MGQRKLYQNWVYGHVSSSILHTFCRTTTLLCILVAIPKYLTFQPTLTITLKEKGIYYNLIIQTATTIFFVLFINPKGNNNGLSRASDSNWYKHIKTNRRFSIDKLESPLLQSLLWKNWKIFKNTIRLSGWWIFSFKIITILWKNNFKRKVKLKILINLIKIINNLWEMKNNKFFFLLNYLKI